MINTKTRVSAIILSLLLPSMHIMAADKPDNTSPLYTLESLQADNIARVQKERSSALANNDLRLEALREVALSVGASAGLAFQYDVLYKQILKERAAELDREYDFESIKLSAGVLPPVISQSFSVYEMENPNLVRIGSKNFKIEKPARMVSAYPTWRDYLKPTIPEFDMPLSGYLPKSKEEREVWNAAVSEGYAAGKKQATDAWQHSLGELRRDFDGMVLFRTLLLQGKLTPTVLANNNLGTVVSEDGKVMSLNVNEIGIVSHSRFVKSQADKNGAATPATYLNLQNRTY